MSCQNLGEYSWSSGYYKQLSVELEMKRTDRESKETLVEIGNWYVQVGVSNVKGGEELALFQKCHH